MAKNHLGKGSLHAQDAQLHQYIPEIEAALEAQPTRPYIHKLQANRSSKDGYRKK
jgi:hypothetical protein